MRWRNDDYDKAYIYARGYYEGRANGDWREELTWMTPEEVAIFGQGYDRGVVDYHNYDESAA